MAVPVDRSTFAEAPTTEAHISTFLDVICADEELVRAEFDAIIAAEWPDLPPIASEPNSGSAGYPGNRGQRRSAAATARDHSDGDRPGVAESSRQRSPPCDTSQTVRRKG